MEIRLRKGISKKRGFQTPGNTLTVKSVASLRTSKGNITGGKNKSLKPTDYMSNGNSQWRSSSPSNEHTGLVSFRMDWLDLLAVQESLKNLLQHHS